MVTIELDGKVVSRSRNLRGILEYSRRNIVESIGVEDTTSGAALHVVFTNGAKVSTPFADYRVLKQWVRSRLNFQGATLHVCGIPTGVVTRTNPE